MSVRVERGASPADLGRRVAGAVISVLRERQDEGGVPVLVLTGGSMGRASISSVAEHPERDTVDWRRVRFLWGDERWVPAGDDERNDRIADDLLFSAVEVDPLLVHRVAASDSGLTLEDAAVAYASVVEGIDRIDVALNGVGPDGHICSLFPGRDELLIDAPGTPAALAVRESPKPPPERVTLSMPAVRGAERVWLLAAGAEKADAVRRVLSPDAGPLPAARATGVAETVLWADDEALGRA